jgi:hypothetical protein
MKSFQSISQHSPNQAVHPPENPIRGKEKLAMKRLTGFVVITLFVVLGCSAAFAQGSVTLGYMDSTGTFLYCNYEDFGAGSPLAAGIDVLQFCGPFPDGTLIGFQANIPNAAGLPVKGPVYWLADSLLDAEVGGYLGIQAVQVTQTKASKNHFGWEVLENGYDQYLTFLANWGYLSNKTPGSLFIGSTPVSNQTNVPK